MTVIGILMLGIIAARECEGVSKRWIMSWDLDEADNWEERKLPCAGKVAYLPHRPTSSIFLDEQLTTASLELPVEGELIFGNGADLILDDSEENECEDTKWTHSGYDSWWDPDAWQYPGFDDPLTSPVPHTLRIPCTRDDVFFANPNQSLYKVHLTPPLITVSSFTLGNKDYHTSELAGYARSEEGRNRFVGISSQTDSAPLYIERQSQCSDITGCLCGTEEAASKICHIKRSKCPEPNCENPISMKGFCCKVCGAELTISHGGSLSLQDVKGLVEDPSSAPVADVLVFVAKMDDDLFHVYFTAETVHGDYALASQTYKARFKEEFSPDDQHAMTLAYSGKPKGKEGKGPSYQSIVAAFITLGLCLSIGFLIYYLRKRRITTQLSFMFRRLESSSRRVSMIGDVNSRRSSSTSSRRTSTASSVYSPSYSREGGLRFLNPIFNQSMASLVGAGSSERQPASSTIPEDQMEGQHENPMYTVFEDMSPEERQASEDTIKAQDGILTDTIEPSSEQDPILQGLSKLDLEVIAEETPTIDEPSKTKDENMKTDEITHTSENPENKIENFLTDSNSIQGEMKVNENGEKLRQTEDIGFPFDFGAASVEIPTCKNKVNATGEELKQTEDLGLSFDFETTAVGIPEKIETNIIETDFFDSLNASNTMQQGLVDFSTQGDDVSPLQDNVSSSSTESTSENMNLEGFAP